MRLAVQCCRDRASIRLRTVRNASVGNKIGRSKPPDDSLNTTQMSCSKAQIQRLERPVDVVTIKCSVVIRRCRPRSAQACAYG